MTLFVRGIPVNKIPMSASNKGRYLEAVYENLDFHVSDAVTISESSGIVDVDRFLSIGQWIDTAKSINEKDNFEIEKIFFIQQNPVIVFVNASEVDIANIFQVYNSIWSFARPRIVFIEDQEAITIYDLGGGAVKNNQELVPLVKRVTDISQVGELLKNYHRKNIESGRVFGDENFKTSSKRADQLLIEDLKKVRSKLLDQGLRGNKMKYAHALIGRAIFIRYLEDRGVLDKKYFLKVAGRNSEWINIVNTPLEFSFYRKEMKDLIFPRILSSKELTFAFFQKLSRDFNGDSFATDENEYQNIQLKHLVNLRDFLVGHGSLQQSLFLWAYRFDVIPVDLISSIYEEFYHSTKIYNENKNLVKKKPDGKGTHYTPSALVDFLVSKILTKDVLETRPRVLDPACGSGIFLVESFRRMVRYELHSSRKKFLEPKELLDILKRQIAGIEINPEAIRISAFSLYLSFLNYLRPPNILEFIKNGNKLPYLINQGKKGNNHLNILLEANSFSTDVVDAVFSPHSFDVVIGNPPWGTPKKSDGEARLALGVINEWTEKNDKPFPDQEPSHAFVWRALELLKPQGICGLLVSSGILFKFSKSSDSYKQRLLGLATISEVISFPNVREVFFSEAISPFVFIKIFNTIPKTPYKIKFISLKKTQMISKNKIVVIDKKDVKTISSEETAMNNIWKIYHWGNDYDLNLIKNLKRFQSLKTYTNLDVSAQGFQVANKSKDALWLKEFKEIPLDFFDSPYRSIDTKKHDKKKLKPTPDRVKVRGNEHIFQGKRILIRRGILQDTEQKGRIIARVENDKFAFTHSIICVKLKDGFIEETDIIGAILWSSLFRYYMFMTASTWGTWHQELHLNEVLEFPIALPDKELREAILGCAAKLRELHQEDDNTIFRSSDFSEPEISSLKLELDRLIFDLYKLTPFERHLVTERCQLDIDLYYKGFKSESLKPVVKETDVSLYVTQFREQWSRFLEKDEYFKARFLSIPQTDSLAAVFTLNSVTLNPNGQKHFKLLNETDPDYLSSENLVRRDLNITYNTIVRSVSDKEIVIIKKNQKRLWTISEAQSDADATVLTAMRKTE